jgi:hypothetical protein
MDASLIVAILALLVTLGGGFAAWVIRFGKAEAAAETARQALEKAESGEAALAAFKVEVAQNYATAEMVNSVASRVEGAIDRLADRLDRILEQRAATKTTRTRS